MLRYKTLGTTISVDLQNGFAVIPMANWNKESQIYDVQFYLKSNDIDILDLMDKATIQISSDMKTIKTDLAKHITTLLTDGFFKYYIDRYHHMIKCIDRGNELFEEEEHDKQS